MSILANRSTRLLVQGITGKEGLFHTAQIVHYGTNVVAGVSPSKGGEWVLDGKIPVFDTVQLAVEATGADATLIFVPARNASDAIFEAAESGIYLIVCITEGIPIQDMMQVHHYLTQKKIRLIGPNSPGILSPGEIKAGIIPSDIAIPGNIGLVSRSGTLTYEVLYALKQAGLGVSTCVGVGGDPIVGTDFIDILRMFEVDAHTDQVVLIGEVGGSDEERAASYIAKEMTKPVVAIVAGLTAPVGQRMGHAGAIIEGGAGFVQSKIEALESAGVRVVRNPEEIPLFLTH